MSKKSLKQDGSRYFRQTDTLRFLGGGMMLVGLVWFYIGMSYASYIIPTIITPVGLIMFIIASGRHISDGDVEEERNHALEGYDSAVTELHDYERRILKHPADVAIEASHMGERARYFKRGKNSTVLSDRYVKTHFFFTKDALLVASREVSLTELGNEAAVTDQNEILYFSQLTSAELVKNTADVTLSNTKKKISVNWYEMVITAESGEVLRVPAKNDMDTSTLCEEINRMISAARSGA